MSKKLLTFICLICVMTTAQGQSITQAFKPVADSLSNVLRERTTTVSRVRIDKVLKRGDVLDIYFTQELSDFPWSAEDVKWFTQEVKKNIPEAYSKYKVGNIYCKGTPISTLVTPASGNDGYPRDYKFSYKDKNTEEFITRVDVRKYPKGLDSRIIALWQSHGRYFEEKTDRWEWQRAACHTTVEDMYTQSYVIPFLIPMLENAGAYVMTPRERDTQVHEVVCDNDKAFAEGRHGLVRTEGKYSEKGHWSDAGTGFADAKSIYVLNDNPFTMGSARKAPCIATGKGEVSEAVWTPDIPERGQYSVYVSYKSLPESTTSAHYTVHHLSGESEFIINQKMGGGTWIYLGTFEFGEGTEGCVTLDNETPEGRKFVKNTCVTADGVRFGGGLGKIARGLADTPIDEYVTSGMPAFAEGALYSMQWAGVDSTVTRSWDTDYTQDYAARGAWVKYMAGGSPAIPKGKGLGIPVDLSFAFHTDAGTTPDDGIVGTLSIYTLLEDGSSKLPNGESRQTCRLLAQKVQDEICRDVRENYEPNWSRRQLWDRSYSESRTTGVPGMLLEFLSHQNLADMKYGLDPTFRFTVSRSIYKGMLKFLSDLYGVPYTVQPLPVGSFKAGLNGTDVTLSWVPGLDPAEPTAAPSGYILYTRVDDGAFDQGIFLSNFKQDSTTVSTHVAIEPGHLYSFRIEAFNDGGKSFPSETLCVGTAEGESKGKVLVVNNFDRVSAPTWFDTPDYAGFDGSTDGGVAYGYEINYIGENYQYRRSLPWMDDDNPGFGASHSDKAGMLVPGNTFDFVSIHGKALMAAGYSFESSSRDAFTGTESGITALDLLCGKQVTTKIGSGLVPNRYQVFPVALQNALTTFTSAGGDVIISGANIGTDVWDEVYPVQVDSLYKVQTQEFVKKVLGYKWLADHGCYTGRIAPIRNPQWKMRDIAGAFEFYQELNSERYRVENPDGLLPADRDGSTVLRYTDNEISAAVCAQRKGYKVMSFGFPLESVKDDSIRESLFRNALDYFGK